MTRRLELQLFLFKDMPSQNRIAVTTASREYHGYVVKITETFLTLSLDWVFTMGFPFEPNGASWLISLDAIESVGPLVD